MCVSTVQRLQLSAQVAGREQPCYKVPRSCESVCPCNNNPILICLLRLCVLDYQMWRMLLWREAETPQISFKRHNTAKRSVVKCNTSKKQSFSAVWVEYTDIIICYMWQRKNNAMCMLLKKFASLMVVISKYTTSNWIISLGNILIHKLESHSKLRSWSYLCWWALSYLCCDSVPLAVRPEALPE